MITDRQVEYLKIVPESVKGIIKDSFDKTRGKANALKAKCLECSNYQRDEIRNCTVETCPLWVWRPFQTNSNSDEV